MQCIFKLNHVIVKTKLNKIVMHPAYLTNCSLSQYHLVLLTEIDTETFDLIAEMLE